MKRPPSTLSAMVAILALGFGGGAFPSRAAAEGQPGHEGHEMPEAPATGTPSEALQEKAGQTPKGFAEVSLSLDKQQLIGVKTVAVKRENLSSTITASAIIRADESKEAHIHTKIMGWLDTLFVDKVGQQVKAGQPLYALYSQELYTAQYEFVDALKSNPDFAKRARERLRLWDVPEDQIKLIEEKGPQKTIVFRAPMDGTVLEKPVVKGHYVESDMMIFDIADLSSVWVVADLFEYEVNGLEKGSAKILLPGADEPLMAEVSFVYPTVDPLTRTVKVRLVVPNPDGALRPGAFVSVELHTRAVDALWIPQEAVVDTGKLQVAYLALEKGRFQPVKIQLGRRSEGKIEVRAGLEEGAQVVTGALFMLDSESRLRGVTGGSPSHVGH